MNYLSRLWHGWRELISPTQSPQQEALSGLMNDFLKHVGSTCVAWFVVNSAGQIIPMEVSQYPKRILLRFGTPWRQAEDVLLSLPVLLGREAVHVRVVFWRGRFAVETTSVVRPETVDYYEGFEPARVEYAG